MLEANDLSDLLDTRGAFLKEKIGFFVHLSLWRYNEEIELFSP
jgi:hypothetical protein